MKKKRLEAAFKAALGIGTIAGVHFASKALGVDEGGINVSGAAATMGLWSYHCYMRGHEDGEVSGADKVNEALAKQAVEIAEKLETPQGPDNA